MLTVATFVPALDPMYGTPHSSTRLCKITAVIFSVFLIQDTLKSDVFDTDTLLILSSSGISILIRYRYDTLLQKYRTFDTDTIVSKGSALVNRILDNLLSLGRIGWIKISVFLSWPF